MIVGFSKHGRGPAQGVLNYLLAEESAGKALDYLLGENNRAGVRRSPQPVVVRGDPTMTQKLINSSPFEWHYTSGVLSFSAGERITPEMEQKIMDEFEATAFAGLSRDRYNILWIRHGHTGREELHFVVPRVELVSGKSLNIAPPGKASRQLFDTFRSKINAEFGLSDPDDPARRRGHSLPSALARLKNKNDQSWTVSNARVREAINDCIAAKVGTGAIVNRNQVIQELKAAGFGVAREGADYITVLQPLSGQRFRLRGDYYRKDWNEQTRSAQTGRLPDFERVAAHATTLRGLSQARAEYNQTRLGVPFPEPASPILIYDRTGNASPQRTQTVGGTIPPARSAICDHSVRLDEAARRWSRTHGDFDLATERFGTTNRTFASGLETTLTILGRRVRIAPTHRYSETIKLASEDRNRSRELEPEMEMEFP